MRAWWRGAMLLSLAVLALGARAEQRFDFTGDFVSNYVFRGVNQQQGASVQAALSYGLYDQLTASVWTNLRLENSMALSEVDYDLRWTWLTAQRTKMTLGGTYYDRYASALGRESAEVYAGIEWNVITKPTLYVFYDFLHNPGLYAEGRLSHRFLLPGYKGTIDVSGALGFDSGRFGGLQAGRVSIGTTRLLGEWRIAPSVDLWFPSKSADPGANHFNPVFRFTASRSF